MHVTASALRIGLLSRGDRQGPQPSDRARAVLGPLFEAIEARGARGEWVVYADDALDAIREQLLTLDGVLVWVNPIQDGSNRASLDTLLLELAAQGVWVSAHPNTILRMGTKDVLFHTRSLGWGTDTQLYASVDEWKLRFPEHLAQAGRLVVKQARGTAGNGVWRVDVVPEHGDNAANARVRVLHALDRDGGFEEISLTRFVDRCAEYFAWSGSIISQPFQPRLADGMVRCYFVHDRLVGFTQQWPTGLLDAAAITEHERVPMEGAEAPQFASLKSSAETEWIPQMQTLLNISRERLPVIWDADFLYGPRAASGEDTYVLCEINVSAVWPYPPQATSHIAEAAIACIRNNRVRPGNLLPAS